MYHIEQLRSKEIADLQSIAQELGIKGVKSLDRDSLIYRILDGQAVQNSKAGAPAVVKEENRMNRREHRRNRIHSDAPSKVYTATGEKAVKVEKDEPKVQKSEPAAVAEVKPDTVAEVAVVEGGTPAGDAVKQQKKRGPKPKAEKQLQEAVQEDAVAAEQLTAEMPAEDAPQPKKRGRKPKNRQNNAELPQDVVADVPVVAEEPVSPAQEEGDSFVAIEDLPIDSKDLPAELVDKFDKN
jgi:transcription termination factor Rho